MVTRKTRKGIRTSPGSGPGPRPGLSAGLRMRRSKKAKKPTFRRQKGHMHDNLKDTWRRPRGRHSKLRKKKSRGSLPGVGYSSPKAVRGLNRLGYREVRVSSARDLDGMNPQEEMAVLAKALGRKKREEIIRLAGEKKIQLANA